MPAFQHVNRRGDVYYLQQKTSRKGTVGYSFARKVTGTPFEQIPDGYEVYENPDNAQVFIRKCKPSHILARELHLVEKAIRTRAKLEYFIVEVDGDSLVVYLSDIDPDSSVNRLAAMFPMDAATAEQMKRGIIRRARYSKMMRFSLTEKEGRIFNADRWCFLGDIDDWYPLDFCQPLSVLVDKFVPHLGKDSFFELM